MKKLLFFAFAAVIAVSGLALAAAKPEPRKKAVKGDVKAAQLERVPKTPMSATAVAFTALAGKVRFDQELFVGAEQGSDGTWTVRLFKVTKADGRLKEPGTSADKKVAEVRIRPGKVEVETSKEAGNETHDAFVDESAVAAVVYLASFGDSWPKFIIDASLGEPGECLVLVTDVPMYPGGHCMVTVTKAGMTFMPGV